MDTENISFKSKAIDFLRKGAVVYVNYIPEIRVFMFYRGSVVDVPKFTILRLCVDGYLELNQSEVGIFKSFVLNKRRLQQDIKDINLTDDEELYEVLGCSYCVEVIAYLGIDRGLGQLSHCPACGIIKERLKDIEKWYFSNI